MKHWLALLMAALLLTAFGCGGDKDKGIHKHDDRPRAPNK
jgi:hypothetical protein